MFEAFMGALGVTLFGFLLFVAYNLGGLSVRDEIATQCHDYGKFQANFVWYECKKATP